MGESPKGRTGHSNRPKRPHEIPNRSNITPTRVRSPCISGSEPIIVHFPCISGSEPIIVHFPCISGSEPIIVHFPCISGSEPIIVHFPCISGVRRPGRFGARYCNSPYYPRIDFGGPEPPCRRQNLALYMGLWRSTPILTCNLRGSRFRFSVNYKGSCPKQTWELNFSGNYITPHAVLSNMDDFMATARADQARPIQQSPDKASHNEHLEAKPNVQKPPRL